MHTSDFLLLCLFCVFLLLVAVTAVTITMQEVSAPNLDENESDVVMPTNLAPIPERWTKAITGWRGIGSAASIIYPVTYSGRTGIQLEPDDIYISYGFPSTNEINSPYQIKPGDRVIFRAWFAAENSTIGDTSTAGASLAIDAYYNTGRIAEISTPDGQQGWPNYPPSMANLIVPWGTLTWTQVAMDFVVQAHYIKDPWTTITGYPTGSSVPPNKLVLLLRTYTKHPTTEKAAIIVADVELYINPSPDPIQYYYVTTRAEAGGTVAPSITSRPIVVGQSFTAVATADPDYDFDHWTNNTVTVTPTGVPTYTFEGANDCTYEVVAHFTYNPEPDPPPDPPVDPAYFTVNIGTTKGITTDFVGVQTVLAGQTLTVNVTHVAGNYRFAYWRLDGNVWGSSRTFTLAGTANTSYVLQPVAQYVPPPPPIVFIPPSGLNVGIVGRSKLYKGITAKAKKAKPVDLSKIFKRLKKAKL